MSEFTPHIGIRTAGATFHVEPWHVEEFAFATNEVRDEFSFGDSAPLTLSHSIRQDKMVLLERMQVDFRRILHAEEELSYEQPVRIGDVLYYHIEVSRAFSKRGRRGGNMEFFSFDIPCRRRDGSIVLSVRQTFVQLEQRSTEEN